MTKWRTNDTFNLQTCDMSPTVFRARGFRFLFFSREEMRIHIHVHGSNGEAKFWIEPETELAYNHGLTEKDLRLIEKLIEDHIDEIKDAWQRYFES